MNWGVARIVLDSVKRCIEPCAQHFFVFLWRNGGLEGRNCGWARNGSRIGQKAKSRRFTRMDAERTCLARLAVVKACHPPVRLVG